MLVAVLVGGALAGRAPAERPRHRLAFDEPARPRSRRECSRGPAESAAGVGAAEPTRPPEHIPDGWKWRPVGPLRRPAGQHRRLDGYARSIYWGGDRPGRPPEGAAYDPKADRWRRISRSPAHQPHRRRRRLDGPGGPRLRRRERRRPRSATAPPTTRSRDRWRTHRRRLRSRAGSRWPPPGPAPRLLVVGVPGLGLFDGVQDAAAYDPATDTWRALPGYADADQRRLLGVDRFGAHRLRQVPRPPAQRAGPRRPGPRLGPRPGRPATGATCRSAPLSGQSIALAWNGSETDRVGPQPLRPPPTTGSQRLADPARPAARGPGLPPPRASRPARPSSPPIAGRRRCSTVTGGPGRRWRRRRRPSIRRCGRATGWCSGWAPSGRPTTAPGSARCRNPDRR